MIHSAIRVLGSFGTYGPASLAGLSPASWTGRVYYIFSEQGSQPFMCNESTEFMTRTSKGLAVWTRAKDLERSMYIGSPMSCIRTIADEDSLDIYKRQAWGIVIGHPWSIRYSSSDDESARGDVLLDQKRVWFKIHDIETSIEPGVLMYRVVGDAPVMAHNVYVREYDSKRNTTSQQDASESSNPVSLDT